MASITQWISVLARPTTTGDAVIVLGSQNRDTEETVTITVSLSADADEITAARTIAKAINDRLNTVEKLYDGIPSFDLVNPPSFKLRARQVSHLVNIWSQAEFEIRSASMPSGCTVHVGANPIFAILSDIDKYKMAVGANFRTQNGECLSHDEQVGLLVAGSMEMSTAAGNFIVAAQYIHEESRNYFRGWNLTNYPVIAYDTPCFRNMCSTDGLSFSLSGGFEVNHHNGIVKMLVGPSPLIDVRSNIAFDLKHSYVAGFNSIPEALRIENIRFAGFAMIPTNITQVKRGTGVITFSTPAETRKQFQEKLNGLQS